MYDYVGPDHWRRTNLYALARWKNGLAFRNIQFSSGGRPVIKIAELKSGITDQTKFTRQEFDSDVAVESGDLLFSWSGNPDTSIDAFEWFGPDGWLNQHIYKVFPSDGVDRDFLFFLLRSLKPRFAEIARNKQTTGLGHVTLQDFRRLEVGLPSLPEQREIVARIKSLHDKIELNRRMSDLLEGLARAIFRDWFVDFGPTRAKMEGLAPYLASALWSLFPDHLDDDRIPAGWHRSSLQEIALSPSRTVAPGTVDPSTPYIALEHMPRRSIALGEWARAEKATTTKSQFRTGEFLFGKLRPYFHKVGVAPIDGICSTDIVVVAPRQQYWSAMVLACISSDDFVEHSNVSSTGTKMPRTSWSIMRTYELALPPQPIAEAFEAICRPMIDRIVANVHESRTLAALRDLLLPKLMSGEIRVGTPEGETPP